MKTTLAALIGIFATASTAFADEPVEKITVHSTHPVPARVTRLTTDVELWAPFGKAKLIAELNPEDGDLVQLALDYGGRLHIIDDPRLHKIKRINPKAIVIMNIEDEIAGRRVNSVYLFVPYVGSRTTDVCTYESIELIFHPDDTVKTD